MRDRSARHDALLDAARATLGFLPDDEAMALHRAARVALRSELGPIAEVGTYLGRSTLFLAAAIAAEHAPAVVVSVDHHRGSEEMQVGWPDHDPSLVDPATGKMDSLGRFRARIEECAADDLVLAVVGDSVLAARHLRGPFALVFLDGGHGHDIAWADYRAWSALVPPGGQLVIHDVFEDPAQGGRPPYECYRDALASGRFTEAAGASCRSLRVLVRAAP